MCVGAPWERLAIDITGPHPLSGKGNRFIITVIDHFTIYAFAFPMHEGTHIIYVIVNDIENNIEKEKRRARPKRNAPMPAKYIKRIYTINNVNKIDVCYRDDCREVEGFGADEVLSKGEDVESIEGDADERDQVEVAGHMFRAAKLQLPLPGETGRSIGKMRGALRWMWMDAIPRVYGIDREPKTPGGPVPGKGFGEGPGPVGKPTGV